MPENTQKRGLYQVRKNSVGTVPLLGLFSIVVTDYRALTLDVRLVRFTNRTFERPLALVRTRP